MKCINCDLDYPQLSHLDLCDFCQNEHDRLSMNDVSKLVNVERNVLMQNTWVSGMRDEESIGDTIDQEGSALPFWRNISMMIVVMVVIVLVSI
jgi:hypothetical protein